MLLKKIKKYISMMKADSTGNEGVPVENRSAGQMEVFINQCNISTTDRNQRNTPFF